MHLVDRSSAPSHSHQANVLLQLSVLHMTLTAPATVAMADVGRRARNACDA